MAMTIENLENAFDEMFDFITDLPSGLDGFESDFDLAFKELEELKSALDKSSDAVEVVRCKDCKYWDYGDCYRLELSRPDDFCSYGELREEIE
mgnify:CR=1 FL=1